MDQLQPPPAPEEEQGRCCCMCGDVGFSEHLLSCPVCHSRVQHSYCSWMYPNIDVHKWRCEWCLRDDKRRREPAVAATTTKGSGKRIVMKRHKRLLGRGGDYKEVGQNEIHSEKEKPTPSVILLPASCGPGRRWKPSCNLLSPRRRYKDVLLC